MILIRILGRRYDAWTLTVMQVVTGTLFFRIFTVYAHGNVAGLFVYRCNNSACIGICTHGSINVANFANCSADNAWDINVGFGCNFTGYEGKPCGYESFAGNV